MMKAQRYSLVILLALGLVILAAPVWGTSLEDEVAVNQVSQIINLKGVSGTGEIKFADLKRVMPNGQEVPFVIPKDRAFLLYRFYFDLKTDSTETSVSVRLEPFLYPAAGSANIVNGVASAVGGYLGGIPVGQPVTDLYLIRSVVPGVGTPIPGNLTVAINGILINSKATLAPIDLLLLFD